MNHRIIWALFSFAFVPFILLSYVSVLLADDSAGIIRQPIPDKLLVFTFDDGCASGYTVVAPLLKEAGFNASFYVSDFGNFNARKDWYLTWEQIRDLEKQGFEVGNHVYKHLVLQNQPVEKCIDHTKKMEQEFLDNNVSKPTTLAYPVYHANPNFFPWLRENGYRFARGGYHRPYKPTVDHPLDVPCVEGFKLEPLIAAAQQAKDGNIIVYCFHGVPDMEHPWVHLDPEVFRQFVKYLKENKYTVIAMRDLEKYIDADKAMDLLSKKP